MFEPKTKTITRWGLTIRGTDVYFPKKETTINIGKLLSIWQKFENIDSITVSMVQKAVWDVLQPVFE